MFPNIVKKIPNFLAKLVEVSLNFFFPKISKNFCGQGAKIHTSKNVCCVVNNHFFFSIFWCSSQMDIQFHQICLTVKWKFLASLYFFGLLLEWLNNEVSEYEMLRNIWLWRQPVWPAKNASFRAVHVPCYYLRS